MKKKASDIKVGNIIEYEKGYWQITGMDHVKPGKGPAYLQMKLKNVNKNTNKEYRANTDEVFDVLHTEHVEYVFSYANGDNYVFMNNETYEEIELDKGMISNVEYLQDNMLVKIMFCNDMVMSVSLPDHAIFRVVDTQSVIKGQTVSSSYKPATLSNGVSTSVPQHINIDDLIVVNTNDGSYVSKSK